MRRSRHSLLKAFGVGMLWAGAGTVGAFGLHAYFAPPADTNTSDHVKSTLAELVPGIARWAQFPFTSAASVPSRSTVSLAASVDDASPSKGDETALREAQTRVAKRQADVQAQHILIRSIQQELIRVGCYSGTIDGQWSDGTRSAMGAFTEQLKVRLPLTSPDYILLTMLQGHSRPACGSDTPVDKSVVAASRPVQPGAPPQAGQGTVASGLVKVKKPGQDTASPAQPTQQFRTVVAPAPLPSAQQQAPRPPVSAEVRVTSTQQPIPEPVRQFVAPYVAPTSQLPGRMAIGAPATPQTPAALPAEPLSAVPQAIAVSPPAPIARTPQPSRSAPRTEPVRAAANPQRQYNGGGNSGGGGGGSRGQVFSRLGSNAP